MLDDLISPVSWFSKMFCLASSRRNTKQRESPGTTSTTQTTWVVSTSSARNPLACSTFWMRRASKSLNLGFSNSPLTSSFFHIIFLSYFLQSVPVLQLSPCHRWDIISQIQAAAPGEQILCPHSSHGACLCNSTLCWESQISNQGKDDGKWGHQLTKAIGIGFDTWGWADCSVCNVLDIFTLTRISGRRTQTTCVQTLWRCCGVVTVLMWGSSLAWTQWPCFDGASCAPPSEALLPLTKLAVPGLPKLQVHYQYKLKVQLLRLNKDWYWHFYVFLYQ